MVEEMARAILTAEDVLALPQDRAAGGVCWWMLYAGSPFEHRVRSLLNDAGAVSLELIQSKVRNYEKRPSRLFPGYIFTNASEAQLSDARDDFPFKKYEIVAQAKNARQLADMFKLCQTTPDLMTDKYQPGTRVRITGGRYANLIGTVREDQLDIVYFDIEMLGTSVPLKVERGFVEPL